MDKVRDYTSNDFLEYFTGEMSSRNRRQLELHALEDPFLQDALDGYAQLYEEEGIDGLVAALNMAPLAAPAVSPGQQEQAPIVPIWRKRILSYVAAAVLVSATGWFIFSMSHSGQKLIDTSKTTVPKKNTVEPSSPELTAATTGPEKSAPVPPPAKPEAKKSSVKKQEPATETLADVKAEDQVTITPDAEVASTLAGDVPGVAVQQEVQHKKMFADSISPSANRFSYSQQSNARFAPVRKQTSTVYLKGKVTDKEKYPLDNVSVQVKGSKAAAISDELGRFSISVPDSLVTLIVSGKGFNPKEVKTKNANPLEIELEAAPQSLEEMVVMGYARGNKATDLQLDTTETSPVGGWKAFTDYIYWNKKVGSRGKTPNRIVLTFIVDENGIPQGFDFIESPGHVYEDEAIRLLQKGPLWINKTNSSDPMAKIAIEF